MKTNRLTAKEQQVYDYIEESIRRDGYSPTTRDIRDALSLGSTSTAYAYITRLAEKGMIVREPGKKRAIRLVGAEIAVKHVIPVPLIGKLNDPSSVLSYENLEGYIDFPIGNRAYGQNELFAVRLPAAVNEAALMEGDTVIFRKSTEPQVGELAVFRTGNGLTVAPVTEAQPEGIPLGTSIAVLRYYD